MYLRYREPVWEPTESAETALLRRAPTGPSGRRRWGSDGSNGRSTSRVVAPARNLPTIELNGVKLHAITEAHVIAHILDELDAGRGGVVVTPNLDHLRRYCHDLTFGALVAEADLIVADGMPLVWASRLQGTPLPQRVPGSNLISSLSMQAGLRRRSIFLLGGDPGTADGAAAALREKYPSCVIAGTHFPPFGFQDDPDEMSAIVQKLSDARPDIVFVALGSPKQERLIARLRPVLPHAWWLGVGNSFSFLAGKVKRAPGWMQIIGMEWLHRLFQEPKRLFRRYLIVGLPFAASLLGRATFRGIGNRVRRIRFGSAPQFRSATVNAPATATAPVPSLARSAPSTPAPAEVPIAASPAIAVDAPPALPRALSGLRAMVLLGGSVRAGELSSCTRRSVLDLPLDADGTILTHWLSHARQVGRSAAIEELPVRVLVNQNAAEPVSADARHYRDFRVERDLSDYRGTGGVLHDLAADYADDDLILVANAAQVLVDPLPLIVTELHRRAADVAVVAHEDGTPSGIMLMTCKALRMIPAAGFVDMKEQGLPLIAAKYDVRVMHCRQPTGLPVRSLADYIAALRFHHAKLTNRPAVTDPLAEDWNPTFSLIEPGATVAPSARLHDAVVLRGGRVEAGAVVVRSIVCPGSVVTADRSAVDRLISDGRDLRSALARRRAALAH